MKIHFNLLFFCILILSSCVSVDDSAKQNLISESQRFAKYMNSQKFEKIALMTHPKIVFIIGGTPQAASVIIERIAAIADWRDFEFKPPTQIVPIQKDLGAIVPYSAIIRAKGKNYRIESYYIAKSMDGGKKWYFADGNRASEPGAMEFLFPGYSGELNLPLRKDPIEI